MSQFFGTNPASRPASGPKLEAWNRELPADWRAGLSLVPQAPAPAAAAAPEDDASSTDAA